MQVFAFWFKTIAKLQSYHSNENNFTLEGHHNSRNCIQGSWHQEGWEPLPRTMQALANTLDCPPELDGKTLSLKTSDALLLGHRETGIDWEDSSLLASFHTGGREGSHQRCHPTVNPKNWVLSDMDTITAPVPWGQPAGFCVVLRAYFIGRNTSLVPQIRSWARG